MSATSNNDGSLLTLGAVLVAIAVIVAVAVDAGRNEWAEYRDRHNCHVTSLLPAPPTTVWKCDDGYHLREDQS